MSWLWRVPCVVLGIAALCGVMNAAYGCFIFGQVLGQEQSAASPFAGTMILQEDGQTIAPLTALLYSLAGGVIFAGLAFGFLWFGFSRFRKNPST